MSAGHSASENGSKGSLCSALLSGGDVSTFVDNGNSVCVFVLFALLAVFALLALAVYLLSFEPFSFTKFEVFINFYFSTLVKRVLMVF